MCIRDRPYNGDELRAVLDAAEKSGQTQKIQLHYFTAPFYKKGTCHIEFTNTDVLKSFNPVSYTHLDVYKRQPPIVPLLPRIPPG